MKKILMIMLLGIMFLCAFELHTNPITSKCVDVVDVSPSGEFFSVIKTKIKNKNSIQNLQIFCPIKKIDKISIVNKNNEEIGSVKRIGNVIYSKFEKISKNARYKIEYETLDDKKRIEYSSDNFCIRPYKFEFEIPSNILEGNMVRIDYKAIDYKNNDTSYNNEPELKGEKLQYSIHKHYLYALFRNGKHHLTLYDKHFCDVDKNDTNLYYRIIQGNFDVDVDVKNKYWAGQGTGEAENTPKRNNINSDIRQNTFKNMKFNKISW